MVPVVELWLPILLAAVFVFVVSSILHMVIPIHKGDYKRLPDEDKVCDALRAASPSPGAYMIPCPGSMKEMGSPEMIERYKKGPVGWMTVLPNGPPTMCKSLTLWFIYSVLMSVFVAYLAGLGLAEGAEYMKVFRVTGTVAILGYAFSYFPDSIWKGQPWGNTFKFIFDGVIYGLVTAGTFAWLWPAGA